MIACFIEENGYFHAVGHAQLADDTVQIRRNCSVKIHILFPDAAYDNTAIQQKNALHQRAAQNLVLDIGFLIEGLIHNPAEVDAFGNQASRDLHGLRGSIGILENAGIMDNAHVQRLRCVSGNFFLFHGFPGKLRRAAGVGYYPVHIRKTRIGNVMINADCMLRGVQIPDRRSQPLFVTGVQRDK